jgi:hypothetical protein
LLVLQKPLQSYFTAVRRVKVPPANPPHPHPTLSHITDGIAFLSKIKMFPGYASEKKEGTGRGEKEFLFL